MLTTSEIIKKVRELEIRSKKLTSDLFTGEYHSAFKGRGMLFKEVREYASGDDIRFIDWNVSARFGHTFSKVFEEERELTVMLFSWCPDFPLLLNTTLMKLVSPGKIGFSGFSGTVHPQLAEVLVIIKGLEPVFLKRKLYSTFSPSIILP